MKFILISRPCIIPGHLILLRVLQTKLTYEDKAEHAILGHGIYEYTFDVESLSLGMPQILIFQYQVSDAKQTCGNAMPVRIPSTSGSYQRHNVIIFYH